MARVWHSMSVTGIVCATIFGALAFTPSLLPRDWALQGLVEGLSAASGYAVGVFLAWLVHGLVGRDPDPALVRRWRNRVGLVAVPVMAIALWQGFQWQVQIHRMMGQPEPGPFDWVPLEAFALAVTLALWGVGRLVRTAQRSLAQRLHGHVPPRLANPVATLLVIVLLVFVNDGLVWRLAVDVANNSAGALNDTTVGGERPPQWPQFSGGPGSLVSWASLGKQGRTFVSSAPTTSELRRFSGTAARRPIRVYVGLKSADGLQAQAQLAVQELRRAGAFNRAVLVVTATTGTGWVDPGAVRAIEYMYNGNTATVALQYSYLWSALSFLVDGEKAREAGAVLFDAVHDAWAAEPPATRPKLVVTGTSLGAAAAEGAFSGLDDMQNRTDGVVLAGAPVFATLHASLVAQRDSGSLQRRPVYRKGAVVRFGARSADWSEDSASWRRPRVLYLQNGSDPIVVWSPSLAFSRPDWMEEPLPKDVLPSMRWLPVVTFWQVSADLPFSMHAGTAHGHNYAAAFPAAWAAVLPPPGWTDADTARLIRLLA